MPEPLKLGCYREPGPGAVLEVDPNAEPLGQVHVDPELPCEPQSVWIGLNRANGADLRAVVPRANDGRSSCVAE
jgi:hypothetical protein